MIQLDIRTVAPRDRRRLIFETFDGLGQGESFEPVNGQPMPL